MGFCECLEARLLLAGVVGEDLSPPVPGTSGPYVVGIYSSRQLDASSSSDPDPDESLSFAWDLDNDNIYGESGAAAGNGDEIGAMPTFLANATPKGTYPIKLKVTDSSGLSSDLTTSITIRDSVLNGTSGNDSWRVAMNPSNIVDFYENALPGAPPTFSIPFVRLGLIRFIGGDGDDTVEMNYPFPCNVNLGAGNDTLVVAGGAWWAEDALGMENVVVVGSASFDLRRVSYRFSSLTVSGFGKVTLTGTAAYLHLKTLSILDNGTLDLNDKGLIVDSGNVLAINNLIAREQLMSTRVVSPYGRPIAAIVNANPIYTTFSGETNLVGGEILVRRAKIGDLNFDDQITIADFIDLAAHFNQSPATWQEGDTNGDGAVTIADFITLASVLNSTISGPAAARPALSSAITSTSPTKHRGHKPHHPRNQVQKYLLPPAHWLENR